MDKATEKIIRRAMCKDHIALQAMYKLACQLNDSDARSTIMAEIKRAIVVNDEHCKKIFPNNEIIVCES